MIKKFTRTHIEDLIIQYFSNLKKNYSPKHDPKILVECSEDVYYLSIFGLIVLALSESTGLVSEIYVSRNFSVGESRNIFRFLSYRFLINLLCKKYISLYGEFCNNGIGFRANCTFSSIKNLTSLTSAYVIWRKIKSKEDLIALKIDGVIVGDLVYDTYLRFKPAATVNIKSLYLLFLLWHTCSLLNTSRAYFSKSNVFLYLTSYTTYIANGVPSRVALLSGVNVFSFGNLQDFSKELSKNDWYQTRNCTNYLSDFLTYSNQEDLKDLAKKKMNDRTTGIIDPSISYMQVSSYQNNAPVITKFKNSTIIFLHDFFDSPHIYPWLLFPDFWCWIIYTISILEEGGETYFIKPHPNAIPDNIKILNDLKALVDPQFFLNEKISNSSLVKSGIKCAITGYGTVASEMAFLGIPTISCGYNPHINFSFCKTPNTIEEYRNYLLSKKENLINIELAQEEAAIFYYMHNLSATSVDADLNNLAVRLRSMSDLKIDGDFIKLLKQIRNSSGFNLLIKRFTDKLKLEGNK